MHRGFDGMYGIQTEIRKIQEENDQERKEEMLAGLDFRNSDGFFEARIKFNKIYFFILSRLPQNQTLSDRTIYKLKMNSENNEFYRDLAEDFALDGKTKVIFKRIKVLEKVLKEHPLYASNNYIITSEKTCLLVALAMRGVLLLKKLKNDDEKKNFLKENPFILDIYKYPTRIDVVKTLEQFDEQVLLEQSKNSKDEVFFKATDRKLIIQGQPFILVAEDISKLINNIELIMMDQSLQFKNN